MLRVYVADVFTQVPFSGNPAGVVIPEHPAGTQLSVDGMQKLARELNCSETAFVLPAPDRDFDFDLRFFTPTTEVPYCGHATIAAHYLLARREHVHSRRTFRTRTGAGSVIVHVEPEDGDLAITLVQPQIRIGVALPRSQELEIRAALGGKPLWAYTPAQIVSTGHAKVIVPMESRTEIDALRPDHDALVAISRRIGCNGYYSFAAWKEGPQLHTYGRMFAPAIGIREDPVTGNAIAPLGVYMVVHGILKPAQGSSTAHFVAHQGDGLGRPGWAQGSVGVVNGEPRSVALTARAVLVFSGHLCV